MNKLLEILSENADFSVSELAAMTGSTEEEVANDIEKYKEQGIIKGTRTLINRDN